MIQYSRPRLTFLFAFRLLLLILLLYYNYNNNTSIHTAGTFQLFIFMFLFSICIPNQALYSLYKFRDRRPLSSYIPYAMKVIGIV